MNPTALPEPSAGEPDHAGRTAPLDDEAAAKVIDIARRRALSTEPLPSKVIRPRFEPDDFFGFQPSPTSALPDPAPLVENLTRCVIEVLAGARDLEQIARWVTDDVYRHLLKRTVLSARARQARGQAVVRPSFVIGSSRITEPRDGVVEAVVVFPLPCEGACGRHPARGPRRPVARHRDQRALTHRPKTEGARTTGPGSLPPS